MSSKDVLEASLIKIIESATNVGQDVVEFAYNQAPLLVQEIIRYATIRNSVKTTIATLLCLFFIYLAKKMNKTSKDTNVSRAGRESAKILTFFSCAGVLISALASVSVSLDLVKVVFAPRLYLIEYVRHLIN